MSSLGKSKKTLTIFLSDGENAGKKNARDQKLSRLFQLSVYFIALGIMKGVVSGS